MKVWDGSEIECKSSLIFSQFFILIPTGPGGNDSKRHRSQESKPPSFTLTDTQACIKKHKNAPRFGVNSSCTISFVLRFMRSSWQRLYHWCTDVSRERINNPCFLTQRSSSRSNSSDKFCSVSRDLQTIPVERTTGQVYNHTRFQHTQEKFFTYIELTDICFIMAVSSKPSSTMES